MRDVAHFTLTGRMTTGVNTFFGDRAIHGNNRRPTRRDLDYHIDPAELAEFNAGTARAIRANRAREGRENHLDSLWCFSPIAKRTRR